MACQPAELIKLCKQLLFSSQPRWIKGFRASLGFRV